MQGRSEASEVGRGGGGGGAGDFTWNLNFNAKNLPEV
jgi:hypothetical protein